MECLFGETLLRLGLVLKTVRMLLRVYTCIQIVLLGASINTTRIQIPRKWWRFHLSPLPPSSLVRFICAKYTEYRQNARPSKIRGEVCERACKDKVRQSRTQAKVLTAGRSAELQGTCVWMGHGERHELHDVKYVEQWCGLFVVFKSNYVY